MEWEKWRQEEKLTAEIVVPSFHILAFTILSLLLPLSFLLLARLSITQHSLSSNLYPSATSIILSFFLDTNPPLIHSLVLFLSIITISQVLTGFVLRTLLNFEWTFLFVLHLSVGLGIEATAAIDVWPVEISHDRKTWFRRALFFVGLYETMNMWSRLIVRPLVDDTIYGSAKEERGIDKALKGAAFVGLWWWRLRTEIEALVLPVEIKKELLMGIGLRDYICWLVYYITVVIGTVRIIKGVMWIVKQTVYREKEESLCGHSEMNDQV